jgi:hypothetical protein
MQSSALAGSDVRHRIVATANQRQGGRCIRIGDRAG